MGKSNKIMYFDVGCRICRTGAFLANRSGFSEDGNLNPLQEVDPVAAGSIDKSIYCNEMAVYDPSTKDTRYGMRGILWVLEDKFGKIMRVFLFPPLFIPLSFIYHVFSYNRRMIAPVYTKVDNDCKPEFHWGYRLSYIFLIAFFSAVVSFEMGETLKEFFSSGYQYLFVVGAGWLIHAALLFVYGVKSKMEYYGHLSSIMIAGILLQIPFLMCSYFVGTSTLWLCVSLLMSDVLMTYMSFRRVKHLGLSQGLTVAWWITLHLSAALIYIICR
ncbi:MAG: hypothetical protein NT150_15750 [Bacteroidetes bacterium]|nr:hypothetical protein [Bacteroidota bacterium]